MEPRATLERRLPISTAESRGCYRPFHLAAGPASADRQSEITGGRCVWSDGPFVRPVPRVIGALALPRRVALFTDRFPERSETFVAGEVRELRRRGVEVTVYAAPPSIRNESWDEDVPVQAIDSALRFGARNLALVAGDVMVRPATAARDVRDTVGWRAHEHVVPLWRLGPALRRLRTERTEHIHVHFAAEAALSALRAHRLTGIPFSITAHAYELFQRPANLRAKFAEAAFVTVPCAYNAQEIRRAGLADEHLHVRMLGTDTRVVVRTTPMPQDGLTLAVGRLIEKKGFHVLIEAAARRDLGRVVIVGDGPWRERLEALIEEYGLRERVMLAGAAAPADVSGWMERASLLVVPSVVAADGDMDALPVVLWEALAMELPVVGTSVAGIPEVARPPWGRVVPPGDARALGDAIADWRAVAYDDRVSAGRAGREWLERNHTQARAVDQLLQLIGQTR